MKNYKDTTKKLRAEKEKSECKFSKDFKQSK